MGFVHFHRPSVETERLPGGPFVVGHGESLALSTVKFGASWQAENLALVEDEGERDYPSEIERIRGRAQRS
jgi:hypothetical protein